MEKHPNVLDDELAIDPSKRLFVLKGQRAETLRKLNIPKYLLFLMGAISIFGGDFVGIGIGLVYFFSGLFIKRFPLPCTLVPALLGSILLLINGRHFFQYVSWEWFFVPVLFNLVLWVGVLNAIRHRNLDREIRQMEL